MKYTDVDEMLSRVGIPYAYNQFDEADNMSPPFICFLYGNSSDLFADNVNYQAVRELSIELYTDNKDFCLESKVENLLKENGLTFTRSETYLESERMFMVVYDTEIIVTEEEILNV